MIFHLCFFLSIKKPQQIINQRFKVNITINDFATINTIINVRKFISNAVLAIKFFFF